MRQLKLRRRLMRKCGKFLDDAVGSERRQEIKLCRARRSSASIGEVDILALAWPINGAVRLINEARQRPGMPVIATRLTFMVLSFRTIQQRRNARVELGDR